MKASTRGYYRFSDADFETLWAKCTFVLDTNVLLTLYRLPEQAREDVLAVMAQIGDRIWIPYQVDHEFENRRLDVIDKEYRNLEGHKQTIADAFDRVSSRLDLLQIEKRNIEIDVVEFLKAHDELMRKHTETITQALEKQISIGAHDPIRERLNEIIGTRVGPPPSSQHELDAYYADGKRRYALGVPPGFADADKADDVESAYVHRGLVYQRQFGDLVLWNQTLGYAKLQNLEYLIFVTGDQKSDWWLRRNKQIIGPHPELVDEIHRSVPTMQLFHIYTIENFLRYSKTRLASAVNEASIEEVKELAQQPDSPPASAVLKDVSQELPVQKTLKEAARVDDDVRQATSAVLEWVKTHHPGAEVEKHEAGFPDAIVSISSKGSIRRQGYEIKLLRHFAGMFPGSVVNSLLRGYLEVHEGRMDAFALVLVIGIEDVDPQYGSMPVSDLQRRLDTLRRRYPAGSIVLGAWSTGNRFYPILESPEAGNDSAVTKTG